MIQLFRTHSRWDGFIGEGWPEICCFPPARGFFDFRLYSTRCPQLNLKEITAIKRWSPFFMTLLLSRDNFSQNHLNSSQATAGSLLTTSADVSWPTATIKTLRYHLMRLLSEFVIHGRNPNKRNFANFVYHLNRDNYADAFTSMSSQLSNAA